jgi:hypothetical protein
MSAASRLSSAGDVVDSAKDTAKEASQSPWFERAARWGYVTRGLLYVLVGGLAVAVATHRGGAVTSPQGAVGSVAQLPLGRVLLVFIVVGLVGYSLWGLVRAVFDPLNRGDDAKGLVQRAGYLGSFAAYAGLVPFTVQLILGTPPAQSGGTPLTARILALPGGPWIVGAFGVGWIVGAGIGQLYEAYSARFRRDFEFWHMSEDMTRVAVVLGRVGHAARGVVFTIIGILIVKSAFDARAYEQTGLDGALAALAAQTGGGLLLGVVAAGLVAFGLFSLCCARLMRM